jgi:hypothetical protein
MSIFKLEGFDMYNGTNSSTGLQSRWTTGASASNANVTGYSLVAGRWGGQGLRYASSPNFGQAQALTFPGTANLSVGFYFRLDAAATVAPTFPLMFMTGLAFQCALGYDTVGTLNFYRTPNNSSGTIVASTTPGILTLGVWNHFLLTIAMGTVSTGAVNLYMNNNPTPVLSAAGVNILNSTGSNLLDSIQYGAGRNDNRLGTFTIDDLFAEDTINNRGERRVETLRPASDSSVIWTPNSGLTNFSRVNEVLVDGDTSYVQASSVGDRDLYGISPLSSTPAIIDALGLVSFGLKTDATIRTIYNSLRSGGVDSDGAALNLAATYLRMDRALLLTNPNGGGAWDAAAVNALLIGPKVAA